jgi:hypothetical protein
MSKYWFKATMADGEVRWIGPYDDEDLSVEMAGAYTEAHPDAVVEAPQEKTDTFRPPQPKAIINTADGGTQVVYGEGSE